MIQKNLKALSKKNFWNAPGIMLYPNGPLNYSTWNILLYSTRSSSWNWFLLLSAFYQQFYSNHDFNANYSIVCPIEYFESYIQQWVKVSVWCYTWNKRTYKKKCMKKENDSLYFIHRSIIVYVDCRFIFPFSQFSWNSTHHIGKRLTIIIFQ